MDRTELRNRTKQFALRVIKLVGHLPSTPEAKTLGCQVLRSGTSIGANYCEACHTKSHADFVSKLKICEGEAAETLFWLELIVESGLMPLARVEALVSEAKQLLSIMVTSVKTSRAAD